MTYDVYAPRPERFTLWLNRPVPILPRKRCHIALGDAVNESFHRKVCGAPSLGLIADWCGCHLDPHPLVRGEIVVHRCSGFRADLDPRLAPAHDPHEWREEILS